ncbi:hypothetical protein AO398_09315 [Methylobacterium sp. GXS13]|uniref:hypothetical protein n=1 Tax=Methylobacterium sp. GXS13 TaxID=1730094 RepID=UPI00071B591B|nr:hypothetical protein [Methylobacterium sp. GXS13]KST56771.1 hypothetical protein AO398_09315 [Methylobacterium sp. GXS13]
MASHAHSTRTPLLPQSGNKGLSSFAQANRSSRPLAGQGLGRQLGPVSRAIKACRETDPADQAIAEIQIGLASFFADADRQRVRELRRRIADRIEADLALLDALDGDADCEPEEPEASATEWTGRGAHRFNVGRSL